PSWPGSSRPSTPTDDGDAGSKGGEAPPSSETPEQRPGVDGRDEPGHDAAEKTGAAPVALDKAIAALRRFALVDIEEVPDERDATLKTKCLRLHRLVRFVAGALPPSRNGGASGKGTDDDIRRALILAMRAVYPEGIFDDPKCWRRARRLDALTVTLVADGAPPEGGEEVAANLLNLLAAYRKVALGAYRGAQPLFEQALALAERYYPPEHAAIGVLLSNLSDLLRELGGKENLTKARGYLSRALRILVMARGAEHPQVAICLSNLALVLKDLGGAESLESAREHLIRALAIDEKVLGPEHPSVAGDLSNLATVLEDIGGEGNLTAAQAHLTRALAIDEKALGPEHPKVAIRLYNLATVLHVPGKPQNLEAARAHLSRALAIDEKTLGPNHPNVALRLWGLATILPKIGGDGNLRLARESFVRAERILRAVLGDEHPWTHGVVANFAVFRAKHGEG
ncbi:MAG: tetratricopeptide repeat protein, partial [Methylocystis sp.]